MWCIESDNLTAGSRGLQVARFLPYSPGGKDKEKNPAI